MRVLFLGTPEFAIPSLQALLNFSSSDFELVGVVSQPDRPAGRGQKLTPPPVKVLAEQSGLPVFQSERLRDHPDALQFLREKDPQLIVIVAFGQILTPEFFDYPTLGSLNVHASLLPKYRGAAPITHTLINGETQTGVTIMKIDEGMDTGDIVSQGTVAIEENTTQGELEDLLAHQGAQLLIQTLPPYAKGEMRPQPQDHKKATYAPRMAKQEAQIDWNRSAPEIHNWIRALNPWPTAAAHFQGEKVKIWRSRRVEEIEGDSRPSGRPGVILALGPDEIIVECGQTTLLSLGELQLPNRARVSARDFVNGVKPRVGDLFT